MGTVELLSEAAALIIFNDKTVPGPYGLFVTDKQLHCKPLYLRKQRDRLVRRFTKRDQEAGLLGSDWDHLKSTIVRLHKEGIL